MTRAPRQSRDVAYDALRAVQDRDAYANLVLPALLDAAGLTGRDAAAATDLVYGTLRGQGTYDLVIEACARRPLAKVDRPVVPVLRMGTHQLLAGRVAPHAAVSTSVDLARRVGGARTVGFVNAVLRAVAARDRAEWVDALAPDPAADPDGYLAVTHAHPRWVVQALRDALRVAGGSGADELAACLGADNDPPAVTLVARPGRCTREELLGFGAVAGRWSPYAAVLGAGRPAAVPAVAEGRAGVQDEGSQLVALALTAVELAAAQPGTGGVWLDLCAGPGGKAALLAGLAARSGARLLAAELQPHRAGLVATALGGAGVGHAVVVADATGPAALGGTAAGQAVVVADATRPAWAAGRFDRVLADVPCSGLGALRRRPEARWRRRPEDVEAMHPLQVALLRSALRAARPGGVVAYVACSPHLRETRDVVADALAGRTDVATLDARASLAGVPDLGPGPYAQLWPHRHGTDAMFLALLRRLPAPTPRADDRGEGQP